MSEKPEELAGLGGITEEGLSSSLQASGKTSSEEVTSKLQQEV